MEDFSPMADVPVIKRDISATTSFNPLLDDFEDEKKTENIKDEPKDEPKNEPKQKKQSPKEFVIDEITETEEVDDFFDVEHGTDSERDAAKLLNRKLVAKSLLDMVGYGVPKIVESVAGLDKKEIELMLLEAEKTQSPYKNIFQKALDNEEKNFKKLGDTIKYFTVQMEEPLRQVMGNKSIDISPEAQLAGWTVGLVGSVAYATYDMRKQNIKIMEELQKAREEMNKQPVQNTETEVK